MSRPPRFFVPLLLGLAALGGAPATLGDEAENLRQLHAMPRERRIALSENLERFDKLPPAEQAAIRKLDAEIARMDPTKQARYRSLMRRYHLWVNTLTEEQKEQLRATEGTEARINLARKFRLQEMADGGSGSRIFGIRSGDFGVKGPYEVAHLLRIWKRMTPNERLDIERMKPQSRIPEMIRAHRQEKGVAFHPFPEAEEKHFIAQLEGRSDYKKEQIQTKGKPQLRATELKLAEFLYFEEHKPKTVTQPNLERFSAWCPNWLHEMIDPLSPDDARAYLTILYRLLYPDDEMPADLKPARPAADSKSPTPKAPAKKAGSAGPF